jgi:hypothetical protein
MKPSRLRAACATLYVLGLPLAAAAGQGDPRLVSGVVEWPAVLTNEPFVIVRGNDGVLYYVGVAATRRDGTVTAGSRVSVLGLEARNGHEINAVGIGSGPTAEAALAQLVDVRPITPAATAPPAAVPASDLVTSPAAKATAPAMPSSRQQPSRSGEPAASTPTPAGAPGAQSRRPATAESSGPTPATVPRAQLPKPPTGEPASAPGSVALATPPSPSIATAPMMVPTDNPRWVELIGEVETIVGHALVLRVDGGRVSVDMSSLSVNLERSLAPGTTVKVYGVPVELRFKAMGIIEPNVRTRAPRQN